MRVGIIGGGAIGLLAAARLSVKHQVTLFTHKEIQANEINEKGITVIDHCGKHIFKNLVTTCIEESSCLIPKMDIVLIAVKQTALRELLSYLEKRASAVVFLQNGMEHFSYLANLQIASIYTGVVEHGAIQNAANIVHHTGNGLIKIGLYKGKSVPVIESLNIDGFPVRLIDDIRPIHIEKLIVNSVINPLTSVLQVQNGELIKNTYYLRLLETVCREVCHSFLIPDVEHQVFLDKIIKICERTAENTSSMLRDLQLGRKTEIDAILGYCIREAEKNGKLAPQCKLLFLMVRGLEESEER